MESRRAESFSDGVFAVAITVLVFNLLTIGHGAISYHSLVRQWPQYAAYVISFLTIGIMWLNHHTLLAHVVRVDRVTLVLNLFLLMGVVAVPFPTMLIADHLGSGAPPGGQAAAVVYGLVLIAISIGFSVMWQYLAAHQERLAATPMRLPWRATLRFSSGLVGYVAATLVAAFGLPGVALAMYGLIAVYYLFEHLPDPSGRYDTESEPWSDRESESGGE